MKKKSNGVASAILKVVLLPALVIAVVLFALTQSFGVGLVIILGTLIVEFLLGYNYPKSFFWGEYKGLSLAGYTSKEKLSKTLNIVFNLTKVLTVLSVFRLIYINYSETLNHFGGMGITLFVVSAVVLILVISLNDERDYRVIRGSLAILVGLVIISFSYMTFGTQLIWIPLVVSLIFGLMFFAFVELGEILLGKNKEDYIAISLLAIMLLVSVVSTVIQFWSSIANFFVDAWKVIVEIIVSIWMLIVAICSFELLPGLAFWIILLITTGLGTLYYIALYLTKRSNAKKQYLANEAKKLEEKRLKAEKEAEEKKAAEVKIDNKWKEIDEIASSSKDVALSLDSLAFIANVYAVDRFDCLHKFSVTSLTGVFLQNFCTVSDIKKQIVWTQNLSNILRVYKDIYCKNYKDEDLSSIIATLESFMAYLSLYKNYTGYKELTNRIEETGIPITL